MQHPEDGATPLEWWSEAKYGYTPIARVLMPDEVAEKDAEIERLRKALTDIVKDCESDYPPSHGSIKYFARAAMRKSYDATS
jgi:hypothetical protein